MFRRQKTDDRGQNASVVRTLSSDGAIAQLGERLLCKQEVVGSIPSGSTSRDCSSVIEPTSRAHLSCHPAQGGRVLSDIVKRRSFRVPVVEKSMRGAR